MTTQTEQQPAEDDEGDPLAWLDPDEACMMGSVLSLIEHIIRDEDLRSNIIGMILCEIDEWGMARPKGRDN